jgi:hypothetical protein
MLANKTAAAAAAASTPGTPAGLSHPPATNQAAVPPAAFPSAAAPTDLTALAHGLAQSSAPPLRHGPRPPSSGPSLLVTGPDAGSAPQVNVYDPTTLQLRFGFMAYDNSFAGGVRIAIGQVNPTDSTPSIITAPGAGGGSLVKVWNGATGALEQSFNAYAPGQTDGVYLAAGYINGDGYADIICGTDVGAQPIVNVVSIRRIASSVWKRVGQLSVQRVPPDRYRFPSPCPCGFRNPAVSLPVPSRRLCWTS